MQKMKLVDGTSYEIEDGASIGSVVIPLESRDQIREILDRMEDGNLAELQFLTEADEVCGIYLNQHLDHAIVSGPSLILCFRERDETAQRLDELDAAVVELAGMIAEGV